MGVIIFWYEKDGVIKFISRSGSNMSWLWPRLWHVPCPWPWGINQLYHLGLRLSLVWLCKKKTPNTDWYWQNFPPLGSTLGTFFISSLKMCEEHPGLLSIGLTKENESYHSPMLPLTASLSWLGDLSLPYTTPHIQYGSIYKALLVVLQESFKNYLARKSTWNTLLAGPGMGS